MTHELLGTYILLGLVCSYRQTGYRLHRGVDAYLGIHVSRHLPLLVTCRSETTQGSSLSPILYLFYNADLLESRANVKVDTIGYVDDV